MEQKEQKMRETEKIRVKKAERCARRSSPSRGEETQRGEAAGYVVNRSSEAAKPSGTPNNVIVLRPAVETEALHANRSSHESR